MATVDAREMRVTLSNRSGGNCESMSAIVSMLGVLAAAAGSLMLFVSARRRGSFKAGEVKERGCKREARRDARRKQMREEEERNQNYIFLKKRKEKQKGSVCSNPLSGEPIPGTISSTYLVWPVHLEDVDHLRPRSNYRAAKGN